MIEGTIARFTVSSVDDTQVVVDASVILAGHMREAATEQRETLRGTEERRILDVMTLGETIT